MRGFKALTGTGGMGDADCRALALGNWHKLASVLEGGATRAELTRLLALELTADSPRLLIVERLRAALARAATVEGRVVAKRVVRAIAAGQRPALADLFLIGLGEAEALAVRKRWALLA